MRKQGTIEQSEFRNLDQDGFRAFLENKHKALIEVHGYGVFNHTTNADGSIGWIFDFAEKFTEGPLKSHLSAGLTPEEVEAVFHARSLVCSMKGQVFLRDGQYVSNTDPADDPAIPKLLTTINTLEALLQRYERGSTGA